ncbi:MAG TPA: hypothetical protein VK737_02755 [Opitutales bacterium]|nr:hypothetical protein [Opitutales bacterium]
MKTSTISVPRTPNKTRSVGNHAAGASPSGMLNNTRRKAPLSRYTERTPYYGYGKEDDMIDQLQSQCGRPRREIEDSFYSKSMYAISIDS